MAAAACAKVRTGAANEIRCRCCRSGKFSTTFGAAWSRPRLTLLLLLGWTVLSPAWLWTEIVVGILLAPSFIAAFSDLVDKPVDVRFRQHLAAVEIAARRHAWQALLALAFLPYEAFYCLDAIIRTVGRMLITHRRLAGMEPVQRYEPRAGACRAHRPARLLSLDGDRPGHRCRCVDWPCHCTPVGACRSPRRSCCFGAASPAIAWWMSRPLGRRSARLALGQTAFPAQAGAKNLGVFRDVRRPGRPLAAARQRAGTVRRSVSRIGLRRPTWDCHCSPI